MIYLLAMSALSHEAFPQKNLCHLAFASLEHCMWVYLSHRCLGTSWILPSAFQRWNQHHRDTAGP